MYKLFFILKNSGEKMCHFSIFSGRFVKYYDKMELKYIWMGNV